MTTNQGLLVAAVQAFVAKNPGLNKHTLLAGLRGIGLDFGDTSTLNRFLFSHRDVFRKEETGGAPKWFVTGAPVEQPQPDPPRPEPPRRPARRIRRTLELYPWQVRALEQWRRQSARGVVEAVTGAGKTRLALQAILDTVASGGKAAVIVPTVELVRQWHRELQVHVVSNLTGAVNVATLGAGEDGSLDGADLLVATASSAAKWQMLGERPGLALLVADECHHYGADVWSRALEDGFGQRLGLTATYERSDNGIRDWLDPYFGGTCYSLGYREALDDEVIAPFRIAFVGVDWASWSEAAAYEDAASKAGRYRYRLIREWGLPEEPFGAFMKGVQVLRNANEPEGSRLAGFYLGAFAKRRALMAESTAKIDRLRELGQAVNSAERTMVFAQTVRAAEAAVDALGELGHRGAAIESMMTAEERRDTFDDFERGDLAVVAAPKLLDEGVDVPAADLAFVLATSRSRRQLIQRMGRVIRRKPDGRSARIVILYQAGTAEDPAEGAHEDFLDEVLEVAEAVEVFPPSTAASSIVRFLRP